MSNYHTSPPVCLMFDMLKLFFNAFSGPGTGLPFALVCRGPRPSESGGCGFVPFRPVPHVREERLRGEGEVPRREVRPREEPNKERFANGCYAKKQQRGKITDADCSCRNTFRRLKHLCL